MAVRGWGELTNSDLFGHYWTITALGHLGRQNLAGQAVTRQWINRAAVVEYFGFALEGAKRRRGTLPD
jgi:hypothetical protein